MAPKFCCCLPLRLGVLVISFIQFVLNLIAAGILWFVINRGEDTPGRVRVSVVIFAIVYTVTGLTSLVGFIGAVIRKHGFISSFVIALQFCLGFQIGSSIFFLISWFQNKDLYVERCLESANTDVERASCDGIRNINGGVIVVVILIPIFLQAYCVYVVNAYAKYLSQERTAKAATRATAGAYQPVQNPEAYPLTSSTQPPAYPYADNSHSFGHKSAV